MTHPPDKHLIRQRVLALRDAVPDDEAARMSERIQTRVLATQQWQSAHRVLLYMHFRSEAATNLLLEDAWNRGVEVYLPRCRRDCPGIMDTARVCRASDLEPGKFGIPEPCRATCPAEECSPDLIIVPGAVFDRRGNRIGYGAGYYDRYLPEAHAAGAVSIGLAYSLQVVDSLPADPWDTPVNALCTEEEMLWP